MRSLSYLALGGLLIAIASCEGPVGPQGSGTRLVLSGILDTTGAADVLLPNEAGTIDDPPLVACYVSLDGVEWFVIGAGPSFQVIQCLLVAGDSNNVRVLIRSSQPATYGGKQYRIVVVY